MQQQQKSDYGIFFTGLASTPYAVGIMNWKTGEELERVICDRETGEATRKAYKQISEKLKEKYKHLLDSRP